MVEIVESKVNGLIDLLGRGRIPDEHESLDHEIEWKGSKKELANAYFAIVSICHQTSPIGEPRLKGGVRGSVKKGWNYLKERFLEEANKRSELCYPSRWSNLTPEELSRIYEDEDYRRTLNRISERTLLINECGRFLNSTGEKFVEDVFEQCSHRAKGEDGFLSFIEETKAYRDPVKKKSLFFLSVVTKECSWNIKDMTDIPSPVDYHEIRGHIRIGTVRFKNITLEEKVNKGLPINEEEDISIRNAIQKINKLISSSIGIKSSQLHYLLWNLFRNCCPRKSGATHCRECRSCDLPSRYKEMEVYSEQCLFADVCDSAGKDDKATEPPYVGDFY